MWTAGQVRPALPMPLLPGFLLPLEDKTSPFHTALQPSLVEPGGPRLGCVVAEQSTVPSPVRVLCLLCKLSGMGSGRGQ